MTTSSPAQPPVSTASGPWWVDAVIYQIYIRSFADGDGDGVGDLAGIRSRLPYLRDLGIDALWITPFYPSPMADGGYDVADYRDIEPLFGTLAGADELITAAHALGLKILIDLVPNHTSDEHVWFQAALAAGPGSPERDRYIFRAGRGPDGSEPPTDWLSVFGGPAWQRLPDGDWYLHLFDIKQPDLNWENPQVRAELESILRFWLDRGVDGFRVDVAHGLVKDLNFPDLGDDPQDLLAPTSRVDHPFWDRDGVHDIYRAWRAVLNEYAGDRMMVAEAWVGTPERLARYVRRDGFSQAFNFDFLKSDWDPARLREVSDTCISSLDEVGAPTTWVLSNHDVTREVTRYGGGELGLRRARAGALLMLALPGGAYVYNGEELGLPEVVDLPVEMLADPVWERSNHTERGRDGCRVPMPWTVDGPSYGFGAGESWLPQPADWAKLSVESQDGDADSTLELFRTALRLRRTEASLGGGRMRWLPSPSGTLVFARDPGVVCAVNLSPRPVTLPPYGELLLASQNLSDVRTLPSDTAAWYRLT